MPYNFFGDNIFSHKKNPSSEVIIHGKRPFCVFERLGATYSDRLKLKARGKLPISVD